MERETGTYTQERERVESTKRGEEKAMAVWAGSSATAALLGAGAAVLSILGLLNILPQYMASISSIAIGLSLLLGGAVISSLAIRQRGGAAAQGGLGVQSLAGAAGVVLGVLALLGTLPVTLMGAAVIVLGGGFLLSSGALAGMSMTQATEAAPSAGIEALVGVGAVVLGILALAGFSAPTLILVAFLSLGAGSFLGSTAFAGRAMGALSK
ncbi:MAG TPA: hypothetical protein VM141_13980 [Planctomycetota bacterium]|nr:hypothetical protein [Planctomycetota bacterium]